jgi:hypothetical protein
VQHPIFVGGVHRRIKDLTDRLVSELKRKGFRFDDPGCWGYGCRGTKGSDGKLTDTPSFHSWGLALDVNAPHNVFGAARQDTQLGQPEYAWVIKLMHEYGFFWIGPAIGDWMHFSFCGSPADADAMLAKAKKNHLGEPNIVYRVGTKVFHGVRRALSYAKRLLKKGKDAAIRVVRRG